MCAIMRVLRLRFIVQRNQHFFIILKKERGPPTSSGLHVLIPLMELSLGYGSGAAQGGSDSSSVLILCLAHSGQELHLGSHL